MPSLIRKSQVGSRLLGFVVLFSSQICSGQAFAKSSVAVSVRVAVIVTEAAPEDPIRTVAVNSEPLFWDSIRNSRDPADFRAYLERYPNGEFAALARNRLAQLTRPTVTPSTTRPTVAQSPKSVPNEPSAPSEPSTEPLTTERLLAALSSMQPSSAQAVVTRYLSANKNKLLAFNADRPGTWRRDNFTNMADLETTTLEGCQLNYNSPCSVLAVDDTIRVARPGAGLPRRDMPRIHHNGSYDPELIPILTAARRRAPEVTTYRNEQGFKAMALHAWGRVFVAVDSSSQRAAEDQALRMCNEDPERQGRDGRCFLYAIGDKVVLPNRLTEPLSSR
jgi:hypothetical protein